LNALGQITGESWAQAGMSLRASGSAGSATSVSATLDGSAVNNLAFSGRRWHADLSLNTGSHTLSASGTYSTPPGTSAVTNTFSILGVARRRTWRKRWL
jgi:hypothetical protein